MFKAFSLAAVLLAGTALTAQAAPTVFTGSSGSLSASASFEIVGTDLVVTLTNTGGSDVTAANEVLTGVFFDLGGGTGLTLAKTSAVVAAGSSLVSTTALPVPAFSEGGNGVGAEWAYKNVSAAGGLDGAVGSAHYGISSSGLGDFGDAERFNTTTNLQGPDSPDGVQYGITSAGDNAATGNGSIAGNVLIKNKVVFTLGIGTQALGSVSNVWFKYGTDYAETNFTGSCTSNCGGGPGPGGDPVPAPATLALLGAGLAALGLSRRRRDA
ncbi:MAG: PEP-CTERM sorting domain-containing protein [Alphaproteobacteria bacterium]|nr:PEP-CTERM sorting domain-containing protein [Alphaproteobacteria bacterium]